MKQTQIKILYISQWEEGNVETNAILDLVTGIISDIGDTNEGINYEYHIKDVGQISAFPVVNYEFNIECNADNEYQVVGLAVLQSIKALAKFEIVTRDIGGFENVDTIDGAPAYYTTQEDARKALEEHLLAVGEAVLAGDMEDGYSPADFRIRDITNQEIFELDWATTGADDDLAFMDSNIIYALDDDQPMTCSACGSRTNFIEMAAGKQRHHCLNNRCNKVFFAAEDDDAPKGNAPATALSSDNNEVKEVAKLISDKLDALGFRSRGKSIKHTQVLEIAAAVMGYRNRHAAMLEPQDGDPFTVLLLHIDNDEQYTWQGYASDPSDAKKRALDSMQTSWGAEDDDDFSVSIKTLAIIEGISRFRDDAL